MPCMLCTSATALKQQAQRQWPELPKPRPIELSSNLPPTCPWRRQTDDKEGVLARDDSGEPTISFARDVMQIRIQLCHVSAVETKLPSAGDGESTHISTAEQGIKDGAASMSIIEDMDQRRRTGFQQVSAAKASHHYRKACQAWSQACARTNLLRPISGFFGHIKTSAERPSKDLMVPLESNSPGLVTSV
ncbi:hypothetical protein STEG23_033529 [Scotinomys teguina]